MKIRKIDGEGDIIMGKGLSSYYEDDNAIAENIKTILLCFLNDCWFNQQFGIDWFRLLGSKNTQREIELTVKSTILKAYGVKKINELNINVDTSTRSMTLTGNISTIFSPGGYSFDTGVSL